MATNTNTESGRSSGGRSTTKTSAKSLAKAAAASALSSGTIFELVERLGVVDMVVDRIRTRLEEVDIDELLDDMGDYLRRNPEVVVVGLGAITVAAGALVFLRERSEIEIIEEGRRQRSSSRSERTDRERSYGSEEEGGERAATPRPTGNRSRPSSGTSSTNRKRYD